LSAVLGVRGDHGVPVAISHQLDALEQTDRRQDDVIGREAEQPVILT
jgi:hypothetical protein